MSNHSLIEQVTFDTTYQSSKNVGQLEERLQHTIQNKLLNVIDRVLSQKVFHCHLTLPSVNLDIGTIGMSNLEDDFCEQLEFRLVETLHQALKDKRPAPSLLLEHLIDNGPNNRAQLTEPQLIQLLSMTHLHEKQDQQRYLWAKQHLQNLASQFPHKLAQLILHSRSDPRSRLIRLKNMLGPEYWHSFSIYLSNNLSTQSKADISDAKALWQYLNTQHLLVSGDFQDAFETALCLYMLTSDLAQLTRFVSQKIKSDVTIPDDIPLAAELAITQNLLANSDHRAQSDWLRRFSSAIANHAPMEIATLWQQIHMVAYDDLISFIRSLKHQAVAITYLIEALTDPQLLALVCGTDSSNRHIVKRMKQLAQLKSDVSSDNDKDKNSKKRTAISSAVFWKLTLEYKFTDRGSFHNQKTYISYMASKMATGLNLTYSDLIDQYVEAVEYYDVDSRLKALVRELKHDSGNSQTEQPQRIYKPNDSKIAQDLLDELFFSQESDDNLLLSLEKLQSNKQALKTLLVRLSEKLRSGAVLPSNRKQALLNTLTLLGLQHLLGFTDQNAKHHLSLLQKHAELELSRQEQSLSILLTVLCTNKPVDIQPALASSQTSAAAIESGKTNITSPDEVNLFLDLPRLVVNPKARNIADSKISENFLDKLFTLTEQDDNLLLRLEKIKSNKQVLKTLLVRLSEKLRNGAVLPSSRNQALLSTIALMGLQHLFGFTDQNAKEQLSLLQKKVDPKLSEKELALILLLIVLGANTSNINQPVLASTQTSSANPQSENVSNTFLDDIELTLNLPSFFVNLKARYIISDIYNQASTAAKLALSKWIEDNNKDVVAHSILAGQMKSHDLNKLADAINQALYQSICQSVNGVFEDLSFYLQTGAGLEQQRWAFILDELIKYPRSDHTNRLKRLNLFINEMLISQPTSVSTLVEQLCQQTDYKITDVMLDQTLGHFGPIVKQIINQRLGYGSARTRIASNLSNNQLMKLISLFFPQQQLSNDECLQGVSTWQLLQLLGSAKEIKTQVWSDILAELIDTTNYKKWASWLSAYIQLLPQAQRKHWLTAGGTKPEIITVEHQQHKATDQNQANIRQATLLCERLRTDLNHNTLNATLMDSILELDRSLPMLATELVNWLIQNKQQSLAKAPGEVTRRFTVLAKNKCLLDASNSISSHNSGLAVKESPPAKQSVQDLTKPLELHQSLAALLIKDPTSILKIFMAQKDNAELLVLFRLWLEDPENIRQFSQKLALSDCINILEYYRPDKLFSALQCVSLLSVFLTQYFKFSEHQLLSLKIQTLTHFYIAQGKRFTLEGFLRVYFKIIQVRFPGVFSSLSENFDHLCNLLNFQSDLANQEDIVTAVNAVKQSFTQQQPESKSPPLEDINSESLEEEENLQQDEIETAFVYNAGLIILSPYLPALFDQLGLVKEGEFIHQQAQERAVNILQHVAGIVEYQEPDLALNKLLCGVEINCAVPVNSEFTEQEQLLVESLLTAVITHWKTLGNTSIAGLHESFIQRNGTLVQKDQYWQLHVEERSFDMLIDELPWNISMTKFSWMEKGIQLHWRNHNG